MRSRIRHGAAVLAGMLLLLVADVTAATAQELTLWSHWAAEQPKRGFVERAIQRFQAARPGVTVKVTWYEKNALYAALRTALRAGRGPDVFYAEPDQVEYVQNNLLLDLSQGIAWDRVEPWAKQVWTHGGKPYGLPLEAWTVELYANTALLRDLGVEVPASLAFTEDQVLDLARRARSRNLEPIAVGVGDRPFTGAFLTHESLLKRLGPDDYTKLLGGELGWDDPRVLASLRWVRALAEAKAFPPGVASLKLGETHTYFHTTPGTVLFPMGSFYTSRAFNPPNQGGQPEGFPLGVLRMPVPDGAACPDCQTIAVGGSYVGSAATRHPDLVRAFLDAFTAPEMGAMWLQDVMVQTGIKADANAIQGPNAAYFRQLAAADERAKFYFGIPLQVTAGRMRETFTQVVNNALVAGTADVDEVVRQMNAARPAAAAATR